ncbi:hypothetical protein HCO69_13270 [Pantoea sp. LS15]|uniref:hypothetical protein n=1 Tax=Pantoea sp. LS15 TaxID=2721163 RepID=UPI00143972A4|nr:hypothetical protein [Pantoea sp. LS15]NJQ20593.1 hypothetical protein [Pantoea sp. LS15]NKF47189.1 hypothetical protein [Pantoea sp. LS15]
MHVLITNRTMRDKKEEACFTGKHLKSKEWLSTMNYKVESTNSDRLREAATMATIPTSIHPLFTVPFKHKTGLTELTEPVPEYLRENQTKEAMNCSANAKSKNPPEGGFLNSLLLGWKLTGLQRYQLLGL